MNKEFEENKIDRGSKEKEGISAGKVLNVAAYPISAAAGLFVANKSIYHNSTKIAKEAGAFTKEFETWKKDTSEALSRTPESKQCIRSGIVDAEKKLGEGIKAKFKQMKYKNILDHFEALPAHSRNEAIINGLFAVTVSLGSMLAVANSRNIFSAENENKSGGVVGK